MNKRHRSHVAFLLLLLSLFSASARDLEGLRANEVVAFANDPGIPYNTGDVKYYLTERRFLQFLECGKKLRSEDVTRLGASKQTGDAEQLASEGAAATSDEIVFWRMINYQCMQIQNRDGQCVILHLSDDGGTKVDAVPFRRKNRDIARSPKIALIASRVASRPLVPIDLPLSPIIVKRLFASSTIRRAELYEYLPGEHNLPKPKDLNERVRGILLDAKRLVRASGRKFISDIDIVYRGAVLTAENDFLFWRLIDLHSLLIWTDQGNAELRTITSDELIKKANRRRPG